MFRVNITLPKEVLDIIDFNCQQSGYNRSEYIRYLVRQSVNGIPTKMISKPIVKENKQVVKWASVNDITQEDILEISQKYKIPDHLVHLQLESLKNYCEATGRRYKNYKAALRNWVLREGQRILDKRLPDPFRRAVDASNVS